MSALRSLSLGCQGCAGGRSGLWAFRALRALWAVWVIWAVWAVWARAPAARVMPPCRRPQPRRAARSVQSRS